MSAVKKSGLISIEDYLEGELASEIKHELVDGYIYAMAGTSANHQRISVNILAEFRRHLESNPCEPFGSDMKVKVGENFFYPDVLVDCNFDESEPYYTDSPLIIVEVLSQSTRKRDETTKLLSYLNISCLQDYVMIEQDFVDIEVLSRKNNWLPKHYFLGDEVILESIELSLSVEEIYRRVHNEDMIEFLNTKN